MISDAELRSIVQASDAGQAAADALKVGDVFMGAGPAADAAGFVAFSLAWRMFVDSYLACLPSSVITDRDGRITRIDHLTKPTRPPVAARDSTLYE
jgi:hypothetical protein